jgi:GntR family transcriptional regulator, trigonelline degradation regulator
VSASDLGMRIERPEQLLRDRVVDVVREAILRGSLAPGRRLTERELGELTGVSRTSLREALRHLQAEGLVESSASRGLRVAVLTPEVVGHLYDVRAALEPAAVELFVRSATVEQIAALAATRQLDAPEPEEELQATREFYRILLEGTANPILQQIAGSIDARIHALRRVSLRAPGRQLKSRREIDDILAAIKNGDAVQAVELARLHVLAAKEAALVAVRSLERTEAS